MEEQARQMLGADFADYQDTVSENRYPVPRESEITFVPKVSGVEFHPAKRGFLWLQGLKVHPETFSFRARPELTGTIARGWISVFLGHLLWAEISLNLRVVKDEPVSSRAARGTWERASASPFRRIFVSYSHADAEIVEATERYVRTLGDEYLRDAVNLRSGERWDERLTRFIDQADLFQLFWSGNAARSAFVGREWRYALTVRREAFIRPTYWHEPMPEPPGPLRHIHFSRLPLVTSLPPPSAVQQQPPEAAPSWSVQRERVESQPVTPPAVPVPASPAGNRLERPPKASYGPAPSRALARVLAFVCFGFVLIVGVLFMILGSPLRKAPSPVAPRSSASQVGVPEPTPLASPSPTACATPKFK